MASLSTVLQNLSTRIGTEFKTLRSTLGLNSNLTTSNRTTLVDAINEVNAKPTATGGAAINDTTPSTTTTFSSSKTQSVANAAALALIQDGSAATATTTTWSAQKITASVNTAIQAVVNGAPTAFDTLKEIADYIASDQSAATAFQTALDARISVASTQSYTAGQITTGLANLVALGAAKQSDLATLTANVGDTTVDLVATFNAALV